MFKGGNVLVRVSIAAAVVGIGYAGAATAAPAPQPKDPVVLVVPAREAALKLAFDVARIRACFIVSYQTARGAKPPLLHVWDAAGRRWMETSVEDFGLGARFAAMPRTAFLLGTEVEFPAAIEAAAAWADTKVRLPNMDVVTCLNAYDQKLHFTPSEWRWFRSRYDLELKDSNANRRRYGRYGPPGQPSPDVPAPPAADVTAPGTVIPPVQPPMTIRDVPLADVPAPAHKPAVEPPQPRPATGPVLTPLSPPIK